MAERTVSKRRPPPWQTWRTFLTKHVRDLVSIDFFTVPTMHSRVLFVLVVLAHHRRRVLHFNVTEHPTAAWTAQQLVDAFPEDTASERHLRRARTCYFTYYHRARTRLALGKDVPCVRPIEPPELGAIVQIPEVGGLHHRYVRRAA